MSGFEHDGETARPADRAVRARRHVIPALAVLGALSVLIALGLVVVLLVFLVDDAVDEALNLREAAVGLATLAATAIGVTLAAFVVGLVLDRLTVGAPAFVRAVVPLAVPLVGIAMVVAGADAGYLAVEFGAVLCLYWVVFLLQNGLVSIVRRLGASWRRRSAGIQR